MILTTGNINVYAGEEPEKPFRVMPLGDSITDGFTTTGGYRNRLCELLVEDGYSEKIDFVGSMTSGTGYDRNHEGHSGWAIEPIQAADNLHEGNSRNGLTANINGWLDTYAPHVVMLQIGTNDILSLYKLDQIGDRLEGLVDTVLGKLPENGRLFLATITCMDAADPTFIRADKYTVEEMDAYVDNYNVTIRKLAAEKIAAGANITLVEMNSVLTKDDLWDGVHPTSAGYNKMGEYWSGYLKDYVDRELADRDSSLSALTADSGVLTPEFDPALTEYGLVLPYDAESVRITPEANSVKASVTADGKILESGESIALDTENEMFDQIIEIKVASEYSLTETVYKIHITKDAPPVDTELQAVMEKIASIGTVTINSKPAIEEARRAFDNLTSQQQQKVTNIEVLRAAESSYALLKKQADDRAAAQSAADKINAIGTVNKNSRSVIEAAEKAYHALTADQKKLVTNYSTLINARTAYNKIVLEESKPKVPAKGEKYTVGKFQYKITLAKTKNGTVTLVRPVKKNITSIKVPKTVKIKGITYKVTAISSKAFSKNTKLKTVLIEKNVKTIGKQAFRECRNLSKVTIGAGVTNISKQAFYNCKKLKNIIVKSTNLKKADKTAFKGTAKTAKVKVPKKKWNAYTKILEKAGFGKTVRFTM